MPITLELAKGSPSSKLPIGAIARRAQGWNRRLEAILVLQLSAVVVVEVVVTSDNLLETRKNGHRREPL